MIFRNRQDAGQKLAQKLKKYQNQDKTIVLGLPRGGVVTAYEVAKILNLPLDIVVPRKLGAPDNPEFAIGAISEEGEPVFYQDALSTFDVSQGYIDEEIERQKKEAARRLKLYRGQRKPLVLKGLTAILVDDGLATGSTMLAAIKSAKAKGAKKIIVAIPTLAKESIQLVEQVSAVDEILYLDAPTFFMAVGNYYEEFSDTEDEEVIDLMEESLKKNL